MAKGTMTAGQQVVRRLNAEKHAARVVEQPQKEATLSTEKRLILSAESKVRQATQRLKNMSHKHDGDYAQALKDLTAGMEILESLRNGMI